MTLNLLSEELNIAHPHVQLDLFCGLPHEAMTETAIFLRRAQLFLQIG